MIQIIYQCEACQNTVMGWWERDDNHGIKICCSECGHHEVLKIHNSKSKYNDAFLDILGIIKDLRMLEGVRHG